MIEVKRYQTTDEQEWNKFVLNSKNALFFHHRNFLNYHQHLFTDHSLLFIKKGKLIALLPATEKNEIITSHGGITFAGLLMNYDIKTTEVKEVFHLIINYYKVKGFEKLIYKVIPSIFHNYPAQEDLYVLFLNKANIYRRDISSAVYLPGKLKFSETKRQMVRKCADAGMIVKENTDFTAYWDLLTEVVSKHDAKPVHTLDEISLLHNRFPEHIKLFEAVNENKLLAGIVIFDFGNVVHTQYMANSDEGRKTGALDFINHYLIHEAYTSRQYLNFGISTENNGFILNEGLIHQKETMGARGITYDFYELNLL